MKIEKLQIEVKKLPKSRVKLEIVAPAKIVAAAAEAVYQKLAKQVKIAGFRPGQAPRRLTIEAIGASRLNHETEEAIINLTYPQAIHDNKLLPIQPPAIVPTTNYQLPTTDFAYTAEVDVMPEIKMGDYKKIRLPKSQRAGQPDEMIKQNDAILEKALKLLTVDLPESLIEGELDRLMEMAKQRIPEEKWQEFLLKEKLTWEGIRKKWRDLAEKNIRIGLLLGQVMRGEKIDHHLPQASRKAMEALARYALKR